MQLIVVVSPVMLHILSLTSSLNLHSLVSVALDVCLVQRYHCVIAIVQAFLMWHLISVLYV